METDQKQSLDTRLYAFALAIVRCVQTLPSDVALRELGKQLVRSGTSVTANVVEARAASSRKDYINFYTHALKSANETVLWLNLIKDCARTPIPNINDLAKEASQIANILGASVRTMKDNLRKASQKI